VSGSLTSPGLLGIFSQKRGTNEGVIEERAKLARFTRKASTRKPKGCDDTFRRLKLFASVSYSKYERRKNIKGHSKEKGEKKCKGNVGGTGGFVEELSLEEPIEETFQGCDNSRSLRRKGVMIMVKGEKDGGRTRGNVTDCGYRGENEKIQGDSIGGDAGKTGGGN